MEGLLAVAIVLGIALVAAVVGVRLGMMLAPAVGRWFQPDDEDPDDRPSRD